MGTIVNTFYCIELDCADPIKDMGMIRACAEGAGLSENRWSVSRWSVSAGNNFSCFVTIFPTGSKVGYGTFNVHNLRVEAFIKSLKEKFKFVVVAEATTTSG